MREIKFRGKGADFEWHYGSLITYTYITTDDEYKPQENYSYEIKERQGWTEQYNNYTVFGKTVGQYTGRKDKNGKEIYEGDILDVGNDYYGIIVFDCGGFKIRTFDTREDYNKWDIPDYLDTYYIEQCEIIGNIHDNPELIGE